MEDRISILFEMARDHHFIPYEYLVIQIFGIDVE